MLLMVEMVGKDELIIELKPKCFYTREPIRYRSGSNKRSECYPSFLQKEYYFTDDLFLKRSHMHIPKIASLPKGIN